MGGRKENWGEQNESPKVSIGLPTYNGGAKIVKAVASVLSQGYPNIEIIISDNCSTDNTQEICQYLAERYPVVKYHRQELNHGVVANYSFVLAQATGDYFLWIADDDTLEPGILFKYVEFLQAHPDYSLVSGQINYWQGNQLVLIEKDFTLEYASRNARVISYYFKVLHGAMFYGMMDRKLAQSIPLRNRIGDDWHFVACLAFTGKVKNLEYVGYNKKFGGVSSDMKNYAKVIGASWFSAYFPHATIALDALAEITVFSPQYAKSNVFTRTLLGITSCVSVFVSHYVKVFPFIVGGKLKRMITRPYQHIIVTLQR
jgi:glycosyltransferase involved in cell wall biosynthesis